MEQGEQVTITLEQASRLFNEARDFSSGREPYLSTDSEIRALSIAIYNQDDIIHWHRVCNNIFYLLACEFKDVPP